MNPLLIDMNNRKTLSKLYHQLSRVGYTEVNYVETQNVINLLQNYFYRLEQDCEYMLEIEKEIQITDLFKAMGVHVAELSDDYFEKVIQYLKISASLLEKQVVVFVNAMGYFTQEQLNMIQETAIYNELAVLFIESSENGFEFGSGKYIIDVDRCEI